MTFLVIEAVVVLLTGTVGGAATDSVVVAAIVSGIVTGMFLIANTVITLTLERRFDRDGTPSDAEGKEMVAGSDRDRRTDRPRRLRRASDLRIHRDTNGEETGRD